MKHTKVLLYGNTGYIDRAFLKKTFRDTNVLIMGETNISHGLLTGVTILPFSGDSKEVYEVFDSYEFDQIIYFSEYLSYKNEVFGEVERLKTILELCRKQDKVKLLYIDGPFVDSGMYENDVIQRSIYNLIDEYAGVYGVDVKLLYIPYMYSLSYKKDYIHRMTESLVQLEMFNVHEHKDHIVPFISLDDLSNLLGKILDSWTPGKCVMSVEDQFKVKISELVDVMSGSNQGIKINYGEVRFSTLLPKSEVDIRDRYGWFPKYSILSEYDTLFKEYTKVDVFSKKLPSKVKKKIDAPIQSIRKFLEVFGIFLLVEAVEQYTNAGGQYQSLDLRLVFVAIISIQYGAAYGIFSSLLVSLGFIFEYLITGNNWHTLFYNLDSWMPIIIYLFVGSICGYFQMRKHDDMELLQYEKTKLENKYNFTRKLYSDIIVDKKMMKNEITGMRDGMGRISQIMERLHKCEFLEMSEAAMDVLNEWFETDSVEIYLFKKNHNNHYIHEKGGVELSHFPLVETEVFRHGIFANSRAIADYPIYASLLNISKNLYGLIWIRHVDPEHISLYDRNSLQMLSKLIEAMMAKKYFDFMEKSEYCKNQEFYKSEKEYI